MSNVDLLVIAICMFVFTGIGMLIGYMHGHEDGRAEGYNIGKQHGLFHE